MTEADPPKNVHVTGSQSGAEALSLRRLPSLRDWMIVEGTMCWHHDSLSVQIRRHDNPRRETYPICVNGKYGYIDARGRVAIEPQFQVAGEFSEDRGYVATIDPTKRDGMLFLTQIGFINTRGELVVPMKYNEA